ncbi:MAG: hypothetical protein QXE78_09385 [Nitrososphaeria archaeon]
MKKINFKKVLVFLAVLLLILSLFPEASLGETPGEKLKSMGLVKGFADGKLHEDRLMKQGELLVLIARYIRLNMIPNSFQFMEEKNNFDRTVNKIYNFCVRTYYEARLFLIRTYYELTKREIYPGVAKGHYLFNSLVILRAYKIEIPEGIDINARVSSEDFFNILYKMLGFDENEFENSEDIPLIEKYRIIFALHGKRNSPLLSKKGYLTRGEVFEEFLRLIQSQSGS